MIACFVVVMMANFKPGAVFKVIATPYITAHLALSMFSNVLFSGTLYSPMVFLFPSTDFLSVHTGQGRLDGEFSPLEDPFE